MDSKIPIDLKYWDTNSILICEGCIELLQFPWLPYHRDPEIADWKSGFSFQLTIHFHFDLLQHPKKCSNRHLLGSPLEHH